MVFLSKQTRPFHSNTVFVDWVRMSNKIFCQFSTAHFVYLFLVKFGIFVCFFFVEIFLQLKEQNYLIQCRLRWLYIYLISIFNYFLESKAGTNRSTLDLCIQTLPVYIIKHFLPFRSMWEKNELCLLFYKSAHFSLLMLAIVQSNQDFIWVCIYHILYLRDFYWRNRGKNDLAQSTKASSHK